MKARWRHAVFRCRHCGLLCRTCMLIIDICMLNKYDQVMKRTTLILEDSCLEGIRNLARRECKSLSEVTNEIIAEGLHRRKARRRQEFNMVSYSMGKPRVHLGDRNALEALMDS